MLIMLNSFSSLSNGVCVAMIVHVR